MKRVFLISSISVLVIGIGLLGYFYYIYIQVNETIESIYKPIVNATEQVPTSALENWKLTPLASQIPASTESAGEVGDNAAFDGISLKPFSLLFLGVDKREGDVGRSDSIVVAGVNPERKSLLIFNIPRDTRTEIIGHNTTDKINHAYAFGGVDMAVRTVEHFLGIPIDYYVKVDMEGFAHIIDILGGVQVNNAFEFSYEGHEFPKGPLSLDGNKALLYSRMRYEDPRGDIGRNERQRQIIKDLIDRSENIATLSKLPQILKQIEANTQTNLTLDDMMELNKNYRPYLQTIETDEVQGMGQRIQQIYYYIVSQTERNRITSKLKEQLQ